MERLAFCIATLIGLGILAGNVVAMRGPVEVLPQRPLVMTPDAIAARDVPDRRCHAYWADAPRLKCARRSNVLVWGDSMAWSWLPAFAGADDATRDACPPMVGYLPGPHRSDETCRAFNAAVLPEAQRADTVVLAAWWMRRKDLSPLGATLERLKGVRKVVLVGPTPVMRQDVPICIHMQRDCGVTRQAFDAEARPILDQMRAFAKQYPNVEVWDVTNDFCTATACPSVLSGVAMYSDTHHVTATAVTRIAFEQ